MQTADLQQFIGQLDAFVRWLFDGFSTHIPRDGKVINDALLGNQYFSRHEVVVINSPLIQRLRRIKQTGLVYLVYPSATHSRFEHCLGVATITEQIFREVTERAAAEGKPLPVTPSRRDGDLAHVRMAALLHDIGHGFCSHASEQIYKALPIFRKFKRDPQYTKNGAGEILSHFLIKTPTFSQWFEEHVKADCKVDIDLDQVADLILGEHRDKDKLFLAQIVSGPFDADKLDYIARDSYFCGLALTVDLPRFMSMIATGRLNDQTILVLRNYIPLEQILFSKMTLFGSVYHHQKVKACDGMLYGLVEHIRENAGTCVIAVRDRKISFSDPVDYLYVTDDDLFNQPEGAGDAFTKKMLSRFRNRDLFYRCAELSRRTIENWDSEHRAKLTTLSSTPAEIKSIRDKIHEAVTSGCNRHEVCVNIPSLPALANDYAFIQRSPDSPLDSIETYFPLNSWTDSYAYNKWHSFVYAPFELRKEVHDAALEVFRSEIGIQIDAALCRERCFLD